MLQRELADFHYQMPVLVEPERAQRNVLSVVILRARTNENLMKIPLSASHRPLLTRISRWCFRASTRSIENASRMIIFSIIPNYHNSLFSLRKSKKTTTQNRKWCDDSRDLNLFWPLRFLVSLIGVIWAGIAEQGSRFAFNRCKGNQGNWAILPWHQSHSLAPHWNRRLGVSHPILRERFYKCWRGNFHQFQSQKIYSDFGRCRLSGVNCRP